MKTKLTLSVDKDLVDYAHEQARRRGQSISGMFSDFLATRRTQPVAKVDNMVGSLKGYKIDDSKLGIRAVYAKKHLR